MALHLLLSTSEDLNKILNILQVGDYFELTESSKLRIPPGKHFCIYALSAILPILPAKQRQLAENDHQNEHRQKRPQYCPRDANDRLLVTYQYIPPWEEEEQSPVAPEVFPVLSFGLSSFND